jgi:hypothetical protein
MKLRRAAQTLVFLLTATTAGLYAQNTNSGDIQGTVTDNSGAVIPGTTVTVTDVDKDVTRTYTTNSAGVFDTGSIVADHYKLTFTRPGFTSLVRGPITLAVGTTTLDAKLAVGSETQKVVVTTDIPLLNTSDGAITATLNSKTMEKLPQVGADWENFVVLLPGASGSPEQPNGINSSNPQQVASINGNLPFDSMLQDGATTTLPMSQNADVTIFETTAEVKVQSSSFSAQSGVGDIIFNQITKGGAERFHGVGYEYFENDALNAAPYSFGQTNVTVPNLRYNNFGFSFSGPIIPRKMFFYFDFDKTDDHGTNAPSFTTVPTAALMSGDFTAAGLPTLYDPTTQTIQATGTHTYTTDSGQTFTQTCPCAIRQTFAAEYGNGNRIPATMLSPVAQKIQSYFPTANTSGNVSNGIAQNNYDYQSDSNNPFTKYFGRLDYDVSPRNHILISQTEGDNPQFGYSPVCPINCGSEDVSRENAQISDVFTFSPTLTNEARFGYTNQLNFFVPSTLNQGFPATLGLAFSKADNFPGVGISGFYGLAAATNAVYKEHVYDPSDVVTLIRGKHILHFGGEFLINEANSTAWGNITAANINYSGQYTSINGLTSNALTSSTSSASGQAYADFLLGQTQGWSAGVTPEYGGRIKLPQLFVQDDYKLRPNLTINLGLRYQITTGWSDVHNNETVFDPAVTNPANGLPGAMWYEASHANGRTTLQAPLYHILLPRVGFSYQVNPVTVVRGGFGIYASTFSEDTYGAGLGNAFGSSGSLSDTTNGICPVVQLDSDGSTPDTADPGCGVGAYNFGSINSKYLTAPTTADARNGQSVSYNAYHTPAPTNYQYTLDVQRQLGTNFVADIAYVGNHGKNLNFPVDINQVPENLLSSNDVQSKPYPIYNQISGSTNNAISNYNALEAQVTKRMTQGLEFNVNYTWSHFLDDQDSSGWGSRGGDQNYQNAFDPSANYGNSNFDIRNMFKGQAIYQLPFGHGKMFLNSNYLLDLALGGWQASGTFVVQGGNPIMITTGNNNTSNNQSGGYTQFANLAGDIHDVPGGKLNRLNEWYNIGALEVPAANTYGDFRRNTVFGPGLSEFNFSLGKTFDLVPERNVQLEFRADADNVLNHASFGQPGNNAVGQGQSARITGTTVGGRTMQLYGRVSF